jgi:hypothetical protein
MSNVGKWDEWYKDLSNDPSSYRYGDTCTYEIGAKFLEDCADVEDWGTGAGGFKRFRPNAIGVDGSDTPFADKKYIDLANYISFCEGIFMRHVLEHNYEWESVLAGAMASATKKLCVVLFTPFSSEGTKELAHNLMHGVDVPDLSLDKQRFEDILNTFEFSKITIEEHVTATGYGIETVILVEK